jgi:bla regulator protein BlaR1
MMAAVVNHLWQSTVFAAVAGLLTLALRRNAAGVRYGLWLAVSLKFLVPFSVLVALGSQVTWRTEPGSAANAMISRLEQVSQPFMMPVRVAPTADDSRSRIFPAALWGVWACGFTVVLGSWLRRWRGTQAVLRAAYPLQSDWPIPVRCSSALVEPGVFGIFRPVLLLPEGIHERLAPEQLQAILAHEWTHVRRRDNLAAAVHMVVEALFWFHPVVWWIGARLVEERERACDEAVASQGHQAEVYAESILKVCRFYVESPLPCAAGVTGSDLKKRIERILMHRAAHGLGTGKKLLLALAGVTAMAVPLGFGLWNAPPSRAQGAGNTERRSSFEVASIKPGDPKDPRFGIILRPGGRFSTTNASLRQLVGFAYDVRQNQITGGPSWGDADLYSIEAKPDGSFRVPTGQRGAELIRQMLQSLLAQRFALKVHRETKEESVYELAVAKGGPKLKEAADEETESERIGRGTFTATATPIDLLIKPLSQVLGRSIIDKTALTGKYDFMLQWTPEPGQYRGLPGPEPQDDPNGVSIFTALEEQLGLKLQNAKGSVEILVIDSAEKPSEN